MNNQKLKEAASDELTHAVSILEMIINDNVTPNTNMFNAIESVVGNINRAKNGVNSIEIENKSIGETLITKNENLESVIGSILSILEIAIALHASEGQTKKNIISMVNLIFAAKTNLETVYDKISY